MNNLEELIEDHLTPLVEEKWELAVKQTNMGSMLIPQEYIALMRILFQIGYQEGHTDTFKQLQDVYNNDVDGFIEIFEDE